MALNRSKYSQPHDRDEWDEDDELDKMSFNREITEMQFEAREIEEDKYELSRRQRSYQNRRKMDRIRPQEKPRGVRDW